MPFAVSLRCFCGPCGAFGSLWCCCFVALAGSLQLRKHLGFWGSMLMLTCRCWSLSVPHQAACQMPMPMTLRPQCSRTRTRSLLPNALQSPLDSRLGQQRGPLCGGAAGCCCLSDERVLLEVMLLHDVRWDLRLPLARAVGSCVLEAMMWQRALRSFRIAPWRAYIGLLHIWR